MKSFLKWLFLAPVAFAVANRDPVRIVFDPLPGDPPSLEMTVPLFLILFGSGAIGIVAGSFVTWLAQGRHRRAARLARVEADRLREEAARLRGELANRSSLATLPAERPRDAA